MPKNGLNIINTMPFYLKFIIHGHTMMICLMLFVFITFFSYPAHTKIIWRIGNQNNASNSEFRSSGLDPNDCIFPYWVPETWISRDPDDWNDFPGDLRPPDSILYPKEIHIKYHYPQSYRCPVLRIMARSAAADTQRLVVEKGDKPISDPNCLDPNSDCFTNSYYTLFEYSLGPIQKDFHEQDVIILKNDPVYDSTGILFDYLELDDQDEDGDWSLNDEEPDRDTDQDGDFDKWDADTATLLIQNEDIVKRITLDIEEYEGLSLHFERVCMIDTNSSGFPSSIPEDVFFPYYFFSADIQIPDEMEDVSLRLIFSEEIYPVAKIFLYEENRGWEAAPFHFLDSNTVIFTIKSNNMDHTDKFNLLGGLAYPRGLNKDIGQESCFISISSLSASLSPQKKLFTIDFFMFFLSFLFIINLIISPADPFKRLIFSLILGSILVISIFLNISIGYAIAPPDMDMNATPNPVGSGARALGMGGAFISIADDATAASWNPAALLNLKRSEISVVGSYFSGNNAYDTSSIDGVIDDTSPGQWHMNYLSVAFPFVFARRNMVFSLNYQHLFEFSKDTLYRWTYLENEPNILNLSFTSHKKQRGSLHTLSPAFAVQVIPDLYFGLTANFWSENFLNNQWENINTLNGKGTVLGDKVNIHGELYEKYEFSGLDIFDSLSFNLNIGTLWRLNQKLTIGGVIKTPFKTKIIHGFKSIIIEEYPENPALNTFYPPQDITEVLTLEMPMSFGIGSSYRFSDNFLMALDISYTKWDDYLIMDPDSGGKISPINGRLDPNANIKSNVQVRLGAEYLMNCRNIIIPIRTGLFYDPEPAAERPDDFYGISFGTGILFQDIVFDIAYQYRFGNKKYQEDMLMERISSDVRQHYLYASMIFYF